MAKSELFDDHGKLFAWLLKSVGTFPVARGSADKSAVLKAEKLLNDGCIVGIFPQGKIVNDETSFKIKAGAVTACHEIWSTNNSSFNIL